MFDPVLKKFVFDSPVLWIDLVVSALLIGFLFYVVSGVYKTKKAIISSITLTLLLLSSWFFGLDFLWAILSSVFCAVIVLFFVQNPSEVKFAVPGFLQKKNKIVAEKVYDREGLVNNIADAVDTLSKTKTGALITFELKDKFDEIINSGTVIHSPVVPELLTTIFFPGTRLHDGAVVIRKDEVLAASVYYRPTTKPLSGKYGSRHRAAIGISEITDSVTVVVSEETGRISIAQKGELQVIAPDQFRSTLLEILMSQEE